MKAIHLSAALCAVSLLAACDTSSGGGSGGGGGGGGSTPPATATTLEEFEAIVSDVAGTGPTTDPLSGTASYAGRTFIPMVDNTTGETRGHVTGDLAVDVNFDAAVNPMSGTATNFAGTYDGTEFTATGTLSSANTTASNDINAIGRAPIVVPGLFEGETTQMALALAGELEEASGATGLTGETYVTLQGQFMGEGGAAATGAASLNTGAAEGVGGVIRGGPFYLERQ